MATVQLFNREGTPLTTIEARAPREWVLNDVSVCTFQISLNDPKCREEYLQYGNIVYIPHSSLPDWVGLLDSDDNDGRIWSSGNVLTVRALSAHILFDYGDLPTSVKLTGNAGRIFEQVIERVNAQGLVSPIYKGAIYQGGANRDQGIGGSALETVRTLAKNAGNDWDVSGSLVNGKMVLQANWYAKQGIRHDRLLTEKHLEFTDDLMRETGKIKNGMTGYGDASTSQTRQSVYLEDAASIGIYGRRRGSEVFSGAKTTATLTENTTTRVNALASPRKRVRFSVVNQDGLFDLIGLGNSYPFHLDNAGFLPGGGFGTNGDVRIVGFGFDDATENAKVDLSTEVL